MLLASACAPQATPTANPVDVQHTAEAAALTVVAQTLQAVPTATPLPPTPTASETPLATNTAIPLPTTSGTPGTGEATATLPANAPTFTPPAPPVSSGGSSGNEDICNQPLTSWQGPTANFSIANQSQPQGTIVLSMYVETDFNQCGYLIITGDSFTGPVGNYSAAAFITGPRNYKAFGTFRITQGNWNIVVRNDSIIAQARCAPNC